MNTIELSPSHPEFRDGIYGQIYDAALAVARRQQPDVAAHAEDIAMSVVERFANRNMTAQIKDPAAWGAKTARYACSNYATRQLARDRRNRVDDEFWATQIADNPDVYPYKAVAGADAIEYTLACLSDRERELVRLAEDGYSHAEIAEMMGYASARSVTTTLNRIRTKIIDHVGGRDELHELLHTDMQVMTGQVSLASSDAPKQETPQAPQGRSPSHTSPYSALMEQATASRQCPPSPWSDQRSLDYPTREQRGSAC